MLRTSWPKQAAFYAEPLLCVRCGAWFSAIAMDGCSIRGRSQISDENELQKVEPRVQLWGTFGVESVCAIAHEQIKRVDMVQMGITGDFNARRWRLQMIRQDVSQIDGSIQVA